MTMTEFWSLVPFLNLILGIVIGLGILSTGNLGSAMQRLCQLSLFASLLSLAWLPERLPVSVTPLVWLDHYSLFFMALLLGSALLLVSTQQRYQNGDNLISGSPTGEFYLLYLLATLGALVLVSSQHYVALFLGLELLGLSLVAMIGYPFSQTYQPTLEAAIKYLVLSATASAMLLFGIALLYAQLGTLSFESLSPGISTSHPYLLAGVLLLVAGLAFKLSLVPFHLWTADIYQGAPLPVTAFLATLSKGAVFILLARWSVESEAFANPSAAKGLALLSIASMLVGNLLALRQQELKRLLGFSSIAHLGYLLVGLVALPATTALAAETVSFYLFTYIAATLGAFTVLMLEVNAEADMREGVPLKRLRGLYWRRPLRAALLTLALISLAGLPLTVGFVGKFYLLVTAIDAAHYGLAITLVIASGIGLFYYLRIILTLLAPAEEAEPSTKPGVLSLGACSVLAALILFLGLYPSPLIDLLNGLTWAQG